MTGVYQPDAGELRFLGERVQFARPRDAQLAGISTIYQEINLVPLLSAAKNLFLGHEPTNRFGLIDHRRMHREARGHPGALRRRGRRPAPAPGAERGHPADGGHRAGRATSSTAWSIMDEPTSSLEPREVERLFAVIDLLRDEGVARHLRLPSARRGLPSLRHASPSCGTAAASTTGRSTSSTGSRSSR